MSNEMRLVTFCYSVFVELDRLGQTTTSCG